MPYLLIAALFGALLTVWVGRAWRRARMRRRFRRAREGELAAEKLLEQRGYRILDTQLRQRDHIFVDRKRLEFEVRADLLVSRRWRTYVVEVKTGNSAPNPNTAATRRQLREYAAIYDVDGLLLADMNAGDIYEVRFPAKPSGRWAGVLAVFLLGAMAGVGLTVLVGL